MESARALNEPGSSNATISVTTGPFQGYHFFKNKASCIFITHVIIIQHISVFSFQYKFAFLTSFLQAEQSIEILDYIGCHWEKNVINTYNYVFRLFASFAHLG